MLTWSRVWAGPAIALAAQTAIFWWKYRYLNNDEFMTLEKKEVEQRARTVKARAGSVSKDNAEPLKKPEEAPESPKKAEENKEIAA